MSFRCFAFFESCRCMLSFGGARAPYGRLFLAVGETGTGKTGNTVRRRCAKMETPIIGCSQREWPGNCSNKALQAAAGHGKARRAIDTKRDYRI
jgi:hypothetical protein